MSSKKTVRKSGKKIPQKKKNNSLKELFDNIIRYKHTGLSIALLYFVVLLIVSLLYHKVGDYGVETDFFWSYVPGAKSFLNGTIHIDQFRGPLYPMILGIFNLLVSNYFLSGILLGIISGSLVIFFSFELIKRIFSAKLAFFATLILAANPIFVQYTYSAGTDMVFNALATGTLFFFFREKELSYKNLIIAGVLGGLSYLTRYNGVFLLGFIVIILFVNYWNISWLKRIKSSIIFLASFILTFTPWGIYCLSEKGSFFYNENYKNIAYELFGKGKVSWDQFWFKESSSFTSLFDVIGRDFPKFISMVIGNIGGHFIFDMERLMGWYIGVFVILGLIILIVSKPYKNWKSIQTGYYLSNIFFFGLLLLVFYSERFSIFLIPFYTVIALGLFFNEKLILYKKIPAELGYVITVILLILTLSNSVTFNSSRIDSGPVELLTLRDWYQTHVPESEKGKKIAARKPHVAYYLNMDFYLLPLVNTYPALIDSFKKHDVDYLYFSPIEAGMRREFQSLLNPKSPHPGLKTVVYFNNPPAVLYKVLR